MIARAVEVSEPAVLRLQARHLVVDRDEAEVGRIPLEDLGFLIVDGMQVLLTRELLAACAEEDVAVVICDRRHCPASMLLPFDGNTTAGKTIRLQAEVSLPVKKSCWQQTVSAKLQAQAAALATAHPGSRKAANVAKKISDLALQVKSGDPENAEGTAAAVYFPALFGPSFLRERDMPGTNALLNYGYAILRASVARALVGAGLHPAFGVHHHNQFNAFTLADDAMEPLRPVVDLAVHRLVQSDPDGAPVLCPETKRQLVAWLHEDMKFKGEALPFLNCLHRYAAGWRRVLCEGGRRLAFPQR